MRELMATQTGATRLAAARIMIGVGAMIVAVETYAKLGLGADGQLTRPAIQGLPSLTTPSVFAFFIVATAAATLLTVGVLSRTAAGVTAFLQAAVLVWEQQIYSSHRLLLMLLCALLALSDCAAVWSIRARLRGRRELVPYWPQLLMMSQVSACYLFAGISKVNGVFLDGDVLREQVWWPLPDGALLLMAYATVVTEIILAITLWSRRLRLPAVLMGCGLHLSICLMLREPAALVAFALVAMSTYPMFLRRPSLSTSLAPQTPPLRPVHA